MKTAVGYTFYEGKNQSSFRKADTMFEVRLSVSHPQADLLSVSDLLNVLSSSLVPEGFRIESHEVSGPNDRSQSV
jgi:hypothetical protein